MMNPETETFEPVSKEEALSIKTDQHGQYIVETGTDVFIQGIHCKIRKITPKDILCRPVSWKQTKFTVNPELIQLSRKTIQNAFDADPEFFDTYVANVACVLMDRVNVLSGDKSARDAIAKEILEKIFKGV